jgi:hypothetical protein
MSPKRGFTNQFKEIDHEIRILNQTLTHFIITDIGKEYSTKQIEIRESIRLKKIELAVIAKDPVEEERKAEKKYAKEHRAKRDPNQSDLGIISDAILGRS